MRLRGHHLICLHFFRGEGYSPDFVTNLFDLLKKAEKGEEIEVSDSADEVCIRCPHLENGICHYQEGFEKVIKEMDLKAFKLLKIEKGTMVKWREIRGILPQIFRDWTDHYCFDCDWESTCQNSPLWRELAP